MNSCQLLTPKQVSEMLGVSEQTLAIWRCQKRYPLAYVKIGRYVRYQRDDVASFVSSNTFAA